MNTLHSGDISSFPPAESVRARRNPIFWNYTLYDNGTHRWIYFEYEHSTKEVIIIPEFPVFTTLPLLMTLSASVTLVNLRKHA